MKNFTKIVALATVMIGFAATSNAQTEKVTATAQAQATIIVPITISKTTDLNFGNVIGTATGGTLILSPDGTRLESGVQLATIKGTITPAVFHVTGETDYAYTVTLPSTAYTLTSTVEGATGTMTLTDFTHNATGSIANGDVDFSVGATLNVTAKQAAGVYTNTATLFPVSVNYN